MYMHECACKINFNKWTSRSALLQNHAEWFLNYFYLVSLCLLQAITTLTFIALSSLPTYPVSMD